MTLRIPVWLVLLCLYTAAVAGVAFGIGYVVFESGGKTARPKAKPPRDPWASVSSN